MIHNFTPPVELAAFLAAAAFAIMLFNQAARAWFTVRGRPDPSEIAAASAALSARIGQLEVRFDACQSDRNRRIEALELASSEMRGLLLLEVDKMYKRINAIADSSSRMDGKLNMLLELTRNAHSTPQEPRP